MLSDLQNALLKSGVHSYVDMGAHSKRPIKVLTSSTHLDHVNDFNDNVQFGLFSSSETYLEHCKRIAMSREG